jgi:hypothetical protein
MLDDTFAYLKREIQPCEAQVAVFELFDDSQRVEIMIESGATLPHQFVEFPFTGMAEGWMADVMNQRKSLNQFGVQRKGKAYSAPNLGDFQGVGQTIAEVIGEPRGEDLRFCFQAAEGTRVNDAIAVSRVLPSVRMSRFRVTTAAGILGAHCPGC